ncbi:MAG: hypothetical protein ACMVY4_03785 [Minwuia sp.]
MQSNIVMPDPIRHPVRRMPVIKGIQFNPEDNTERKARLRRAEFPLSPAP